MIDVCETMLLNVRTNLMQNKRTNDEIKAMLDDLFESNNIEFKRMQRLYGDDKFGKDTFGIMQFEFYELEKLKKRMYGDDYEIQSFMYEKNIGE